MKMQTDKLSDNWLFQQHAKHELKGWLHQLRYFYFKRAWGGHANDGDELQLAFLYESREDLLNKMAQLGLTLNKIPENYPKPVMGQSYSAAEFEKFKHEIKLYPNLEQPAYSIIFGQEVFIWINEKSIHITVSGTGNGDRYNVSEADFIVCMELEKHFDLLGWQNIIDKSIENSVCCISQTRYPELYGDTMY